MTSTNLGQAPCALLQDQPVFVLGAALDTVTEPVVPKGYRKTRDAGRNQCGMSSGGGGKLKSRATTLQESRSSRGLGLPSQGQGPLEMVSSNPLTAGSARTAGVEKSQKKASAGSKKNTGAGGIDVDTNGCMQTENIC